MPLEYHNSPIPDGEPCVQQSVRDLVETPRGYRAEAPNVVTAAGVALAYDVRKRYIVRTLQNISDAAVMWSADENNNPEENSCHGILAAASAENAGDGGQVDLSKIPGTIRVKGVAAGTVKVIATQVSRP